MRSLWRWLFGEGEPPSLNAQVLAWYARTVDGEPEIKPIKLPPVKPLKAVKVQELNDFPAR